MLINKIYGIGLLGAIAQKLANSFIDQQERAIFINEDFLRNPFAGLINIGVNLVVDPPNHQ